MTSDNQLIKEISSSDVKMSIQEKQAEGQAQVLTYIGYRSIRRFRSKQDKWLDRFQEVLYQLPFSACKNEKSVFLNLHDGITKAENNIKVIQTRINKLYRYKTQIKVSKGRVKDEFNPNYYPSLKDHQHHKVHAMVFIHLKTIRKAVRILKEFANNSSVQLKAQLELDLKVDKVKFKSVYNAKQLAKLMAEFFEEVAPGYNKKQLAKLVAENFETKRSKELSENQVYKGMYSKEDNLVREIGVKWINRKIE